jgi:hypothetical protein
MLKPPRQRYLNLPCQRSQFPVLKAASTLPPLPPPLTSRLHQTQRPNPLTLSLPAIVQRRHPSPLMILIVKFSRLSAAQNQVPLRLLTSSRTSLKAIPISSRFQENGRSPCSIRPSNITGCSPYVRYRASRKFQNA